LVGEGGVKRGVNRCWGEKKNPEKSTKRGQTRAEGGANQKGQARHDRLPKGGGEGRFLCEGARIKEKNLSWGGLKKKETWGGGRPC